MAPGIATIPTIDTCSRMTLRFEDVQKLSLRVPKNRLSRIRATSRPPLWYAASRLATPRAPPAGRRRGAPGRRVVPGCDTRYPVIALYRLMKALVVARPGP